MIPRVTSVRLTRAPDPDQERGLLGWVYFVLDGALALDGVALRRTRDGRRTLSFPSRRDREGRQHPYVRPLSAEARSAIEEQVLDALGLGPEVGR